MRSEEEIRKRIKDLEKLMTETNAGSVKFILFELVNELRWVLKDI